MNFLIDHNIEGYAILLLGTLTAAGWLEIVPIEFVMFERVGLAINASDRVVWNFAQTNQMILLTANRSMKGIDSLEQTIQEENTENSLPVITIGNTDRMTNFEYRERCSIRLVEILLDLDNCMGAGRLFIP